MRNSKSLKRVLSIMVSASMMVTASGVLTAPLQVSAAETTIIPVQLGDVSQDEAGWYYGDEDWIYQYSGNENSKVSYDEEGDALKVTVDYSKDSDISWSQAGICFHDNDGMNLAGVNNVTFDIFYDISLRTKGDFP